MGNNNFMEKINDSIIIKSPETHQIIKDNLSRSAMYGGYVTKGAVNTKMNILNRKRKYGYDLFDYEVKLIEHLEPVLIEVFRNE